MTPSSTRADAGEEVTDFSPPATPNANPELPPSDDNFVRSDLTPNNLPADAIATNPMFKNLQSQSGGGPGAAPSITSSMASQYDSKGSGDQTQMLLDVSGVSTPTGTPRAAHRDLEGSLAGSARGEGSVADADDLSKRLEGMDVRDDEKDDNEEQLVDRDPTPETPKAEDSIAAQDDDEQGARDVDMGETNEAAKDDGTYVTTDMDADAADFEAEKGHGGAEPVPELPVDGRLTHDPQGALKDPEAKIEYTTKNEDAESKPHVSSSSDKRDPNEDEDLDALKQGKLHPSASPAPGQPEAGKHTLDQNPLNNLVEASLSQDVAEHQLSTDETKHQGGVAGQRMQDVDNANEVIQPDETTPSGNASTDGGPEIRDATPVPVSTKGDEPLGPKGALDGPQKFNVEWLEQGRGQSKAADLDGQEYHFKDTPGDDKTTEKDESKSTDKSDDSVESEVKEDDLKSTGEDGADSPTVAADTTADVDRQIEETQSQDKNILQSQEDMAPVLPDAPSTEPKVESSRPTQIHIEPAPIAQPSTAADDDVTPGATLAGSSASVLDTSDEPTPSASADAELEPTSAPQFPDPPSEDPDVVDPISNSNSQPQTRPTSSVFDDSQSGVSTPIDPSFVRAFPEVPDEQKPRVEVHVSSPVNTPKKAIQTQESGVGAETASGSGGDGDKARSRVNQDGTPVADLPGTSKSLSYPDLSRSESGLSESDENHTNTRTPEGLNKRLSARRSPKSPLLGDEDPGDFTPGEGWAVVTK